MENRLKRQRLDKTESFAHRYRQENGRGIFWSELTYCQTNKSLQYWWDSCKAMCSAIVQNVLGEESGRKIQAISLSDNTVQWRIDLILNDIKVVIEVKDKSFFWFVFSAAWWINRCFSNSSADGLVGCYITEQKVWMKNCSFAMNWKPPQSQKMLCQRSRIFFNRENICYVRIQEWISDTG